MQIISYLSYCNRILTGLPASALALQLLCTSSQRKSVHRASHKTFHYTLPQSLYKTLGSAACHYLTHFLSFPSLTLHQPSWPPYHSLSSPDIFASQNNCMCSFLSVESTFQMIIHGLLLSKVLQLFAEMLPSQWAPSIATLSQYSCFLLCFFHWHFSHSNPPNNWCIFLIYASPSIWN